MQLFEKAVHASWNTGIARRLLAVALAQIDDKKIASANRYIAQYERAFSSAIKEIRALQTDLALRVIEENEPIAHLPMTCQIRVIASEATKLARSATPNTPDAKRTHRFATLMAIGAAFEPQTSPSPASQDIPQAA